MPTPTAFFQGEFIPMENAKIGIMTHAFNYGTAVFEGIRGNWNHSQEQLYLFRPREHIERLRQSAKIMRMQLNYSDDELVKITHELALKNGYTEDVYIRPMVYKSSEAVGVRMHDLEDDFLLFVTPFGAYLDTEIGARCMTSSWRRIDDTMIPARAKVNGLYVNNAMAKTEAQLNGFDEAIMLNVDGHISEGSGENIVMIKGGTIITPPPQDNILEGITLETVLSVAQKDLNLPIVRRSIDRSELYIAEEVLMTGTAAHVTPVTEVDRVPVGSGKPGPISKKLQDTYFQIVTGELADYQDWLDPIYPK
ncbi:MAG: branched-chain amino acid transaminase [Dehalococcoidia bacterium]|jgi:branched-chain amino acid aminotransferase|nr:branched-chain amino acid transaminase [Dehalococcoidia bacterium]|tara:strand:+ start:5251 stop:6174 length:924 start_codon:yes stop_codon:yes gene_type:complete